MSGEGHLLIVTTNLFPIGKWGEVSESTGHDHEQIQYLLSHNLIGKFHPDNVTLLKNASTNEFKDAMHTLKKHSKEYGFIVIYLATHVVTVIKGEKKENPKEVCYFAFHNSVWGKPAEIAESCVSLSSFTALLNKIHCPRKTVIVNYAHQPKPKSVLFPSSKILYPPSNFLSQLAEMGKCVVIGSCAIGTRAKEYLSHSEYHNQQDYAQMTAPTNDGRDAAEARANSSSVLGFMHRRSNKAKYDRMLVELMKEWGCKPFPDISKSPRPIKPSATWQMEEGTINITLPDQKQVCGSYLFYLNFLHIYLVISVQRNNYMRRLIYWKAKRTIAKPGNFTMEQVRSHLKRTFCSPCQMSAVDVREAE